MATDPKNPATYAGYKAKDEGVRITGIHLPWGDVMVLIFQIGVGLLVWSIPILIMFALLLLS